MPIILNNGRIATITEVDYNGWVCSKLRAGFISFIAPEDWQPLPESQTKEQAYFLGVGE